MSANKLLKVFLWLVAIHSLFTGIFLITGSVEMFKFFGFPYHGGFFSVQGGVFHLVMVVAYLMTASNLGKNSLLIWFCISAKLMAAAFLILYFFLHEKIWIVLISGIGDLIMGVLIYTLNKMLKDRSHA